MLSVGQVDLAALKDINRVLGFEPRQWSQREIADLHLKARSKQWGKRNYWHVVNYIVKRLAAKGGHDQIGLGEIGKATRLSVATVKRHLRTARLRGLFTWEITRREQGYGRSASIFTIGENGEKLPPYQAVISKAQPTEYYVLLRENPQDSQALRAMSSKEDSARAREIFLPGLPETYYIVLGKCRTQGINARRVKPVSRPRKGDEVYAILNRRPGRKHHSVTITRAGLKAMRGLWTLPEYVYRCMSKKQKAMLMLARHGLDPILNARAAFKLLRQGWSLLELGELLSMDAEDCMGTCADPQCDKDKPNRLPYDDTGDDPSPVCRHVCTPLRPSSRLVEKHHWRAMHEYLRGDHPTFNPLAHYLSGQCKGIQRLAEMLEWGSGREFDLEAAA